MLVPTWEAGSAPGCELGRTSILAALAARLVDRPGQGRSDPPADVHLDWAPRADRDSAYGSARQETAGWPRSTTRRPPRSRSRTSTSTRSRMTTGSAYACPNVATRDRLVRLNIASPGAMRGPGRSRATSRSSQRLTSCLTSWEWIRSSCGCVITPRFTRSQGCGGRAMRFGTATGSAPSDLAGDGATRGSDRCARDTGWSGTGAAGVTFGSYQAPCQARITVERNGTALVRSSATDIGTGRTRSLRS